MSIKDDENVNSHDNFKMKFIVLFALIASAHCFDGLEDDYFNPIEESISAFDDNSTIVAANVACSLNINTQLGNPQPLYLRPGTTQFFHPTSRPGFMEFTANQNMELFCSNGFESPNRATGNLITVTCFSGVSFRFDNILFNINTFRCREWPTYVAQRRVTTQRCFNQGVFVDIGFQVAANRFVRVFSTCHNPVAEVNYYAEYILGPMAAGQERSVVRPSWAQGDFFPGKNVDLMHTRNNQRNTIATILGSSTAAARFVEQPDSNLFMARGHMAAMTDFISANEQRSTFLFINTAPQWQTFNGFNWNSVEISSRHLATNRNIHLETYTGTVGVTQLWNEAGARREIFIDGPRRQIPSPQLYYKILVNRANRAGVVLLGVNNPFLTLSEILQTHVICTDVSARINYVSWQRTNLLLGYGYACEVNDFLRRVPHHPGLIVNSLLV